MSEYIIRLDDACERRNVENWDRMENLLDKYSIKPLVGVIADCRDEEMAGFDFDQNFWERVTAWQDKEWIIAMHGYQHLYSTEQGGINPVNLRSEFAGESLETQIKKIDGALKIFREHKIEPFVFFAPSHTFDENTLRALEKASDIKVISDTIANKPYQYRGFTFVPQQSGKVRSLPFKLVTFCYHPNIMSDSDFMGLEEFLQKNKEKFIKFPITHVTNKKTLYDKFLNWLYFIRK